MSNVHNWVWISRYIFPSPNWMSTDSWSTWWLVLTTTLSKANRIFSIQVFNSVSLLPLQVCWRCGMRFLGRILSSKLLIIIPEISTEILSYFVVCSACLASLAAWYPSFWPRRSSSWWWRLPPGSWSKIFGQRDRNRSISRQGSEILQPQSCFVLNWSTKVQTFLKLIVIINDILKCVNSTVLSL